MPTMNEIYERHAREYDELVACEDYRGNLGKALESLVPEGARVLELGAGTGRVTKLYAERARAVTCCDRSAHMLDRARRNLSAFAGKIGYSLADNDALDKTGGSYDVIIEGWSFGHSAVAHASEVPGWFAALHTGLLGLLSPEGSIVIIETLGTLSGMPSAPGPVLGEFYDLLEGSFGYCRTVLDTSYRFGDGEEARRIIGFFFGHDMAARVDGPLVPEYSGLWHFRRGSDDPAPART
jgi:SAM-dependent methyltransferase